MVHALHAQITPEYQKMDTHVDQFNAQTDYQSSKRMVPVFHAQPTVNATDQMLWELSVFHPFVQKTALELKIVAARSALDTTDQIVILPHVFKTHVPVEKNSQLLVLVSHAPTVKLLYQVNYPAHSPNVETEIS